MQALTTSGCPAWSLAKPRPALPGRLPDDSAPLPSHLPAGEGWDQLSLQLPRVGGADGVLLGWLHSSICQSVGNRRLENCLSELPPKDLAAGLNLHGRLLHA